MMHCLKSTRSHAVGATAPRAKCGPTNFASPRTTSTLRCLASTLSPPVSLRRPPGSSRRAACSRSICGGAEHDAARRPCRAASSITLAACSSALEGMQPTFRHTPPEHRPALDQRDLEPEIGGAKGRGVAAGPGAEHHQIERAGGASAGAGARASARRRGAGAGAAAGAAAAGAAAAPARRRSRRRRGGRGSARRRRDQRARRHLLALLDQRSSDRAGRGDGTSMDAFSVSSVIERIVHARPARPTATSTSTTVDVLGVAEIGNPNLDRAHSSAFTSPERLGSGTR